ncbi:hypothetical protein [Oleisolibacter albus]|uniref:hypothetical protein n=1 Tax=Oleisolibacter albus TaxID=2171757 RepID=UPI000DF37CF9|nr:hypothetical protein [Oleisolibacter albus]
MASSFSLEKTRREDRLDREDRRLRQRTLALLSGPGRHDSDALLALRDDWERHIADLEAEMAAVRTDMAGDRQRRQALTIYQMTSRFGGSRHRG